MAKCEKCGEEYPDGTEHVCSSSEGQKPEADASQEEAAQEETSPEEASSGEEKAAPAEETPSLKKTENFLPGKKRG